MSVLKSQRKRQMREEEYDLHVFELDNTDGWGSLLDLNEGPSAPWITAAPGQLHKAYMCCLVLRDEPSHKRPFKPELQSLRQQYGTEPWWPYATRIAIVVPVAVQGDIAMAQGIKRLGRTCPCAHLSGLGMTLLASVVRHFKTEYLFMSPIDRFAGHVPRELSARGVPFGQLGERSLWWAVTDSDPHSGSDRVNAEHRWLTMTEGDLHYIRNDHSRRREVYFLQIRPRPPYSGICHSRTLLLNAAHYRPRGGYCDPEHEAPPLVKTYETHDFLWFLAGDGVLVIHGPSLGLLPCVPV
jgi:hypothetical protein